MNILVRVPNWLGDAVMSLPFFDLLGSRVPEARVDIIARDLVADLFRHHPGINAIHPFSKRSSRGLGGLLSFGRRLGRLKSYHGFITLAPSFSSALIGVAACRGMRIGYRGEGRSLLLTRRPALPAGLHRVQAYSRLIDYLPGAVSGGGVPPVRYPFPAVSRRRPASAGPHRSVDIVFNVNSQAATRRLPASTWVALGNRLLADSSSPKRILFVGTSGEQQRVDRVKAGIHNQDALVDLCGQTRLEQLARVMRRADLVISNDSGPMHLANAVGTPLLTFFGAGDPQETGPFNSSASTRIISRPMACAPCRKNTCRHSRLHCLEDISAGEIHAAAMQLLNRP